MNTAVADNDDIPLTINEWREKNGYPPVEWGDAPWSPVEKGQFERAETKTLEGDVQMIRHDNGMLEILDAPPVTRISLELIHGADPAVFKVSGRKITLAGQVVYEITGWNNFSASLTAKLVEDRRPGRG